MTQSPSVQQIESGTILEPNQFVTGVRGWTGSDVVLTGNAAGNGPTTSLIYVGPLLSTAQGTTYIYPPVFDGQTVTSSTFYGPDTFVFNPALGEGNIRAVGSYQYSQSDVINHGMLYEGPPDGSGSWTQIDVPSSAVGGKTVWNTIPHSNMGDLVVGDYDLKGEPFSANAFLYDIRQKSWTIFDFAGCNLTTAYGIWQQSPGSCHYTIVGGTHDGHGTHKGFVVAYDSQSGAFSNLKLYSFMNQPALLTHFEGITATPTGFNLAAMSTGSAAAALASIRVHPDGSFSDAEWTPYGYPGAIITTGNSIYQNVLMGIFAESGTKGIQSYVASFPV